MRSVYASMDTIAQNGPATITMYFSDDRETEESDPERRRARAMTCR